MDLQYRNFILNASPCFIFAFIPKVACTSWKSLLRYLAGHRDDYLKPRLAHDRPASGLHYLALTGAEGDLLRDPAIPKYTMVRDPFSRALSAYLNKVENRLDPSLRKPDYFSQVNADIEAFRREYLDPALSPRIDFEVFLRWVQARPTPRALNEHWAPQTRILGLPHLRYDLMGRFEQMDVDAPSILSAMGADIPLPTPQQIRFPPTNATDRLAAYYTPACTALVREIYADDFRLLGYSTDLRAMEPC